MLMRNDLQAVTMILLEKIHRHIDLISNIYL